MAIKILVVEDNLHIRDNMVEILELENYEVYAASNGKEGLDKAKEIFPNLILCDIQMPVMDGYQLLKSVQELPDLAESRFIFFTSYSEPKDILYGLRMGADEFLVKPFSGEDLLKVVEKHLG